MIKVKTLTRKEIDIEPTDIIDWIKERVEEKKEFPQSSKGLYSFFTNLFSLFQCLVCEIHISPN